MSEYEAETIRFETARREAMDRYFEARPQIFRTKDKEYYFESGFRMAWEHLTNPNRASQG